MPSRPRTATHPVLVALAAALLLSSSSLAHGQDDAQPAVFQQVDQFFGEWLVTPLFKLLFWDVCFWDNKLPPGEGVGSRVDGKTVVAAGADGYELRETRTVPVFAARRVFDKPETLQLGELTLTVAEGPGDQLVGTIAAGSPLSLGDCDSADSCGVPLAEAASATDDRGPMLTGGAFPTRPTIPHGLDGVRVIEDRAPFAVAVTVVDGALLTVEQTVDLPRGVAIPRPGDHVVVGDQEYEAVALHGHALEVQGLQTVAMPGRLPNPDQTDIPLVVAWLVFGATFFTLRMGFINLRGFGHALQVTSGAFDNPDDPGEVSHFQALSSALSATVGLGNIAGVALAVAAGGPGAVFWMIVAGFLGMSSKFVECTLGQLYRVVDDQGRVSGGPMQYLSKGLAGRGFGPLGRVLAVIFALMCIGGSLGGGNMFQANQSYAAIADVVPAFAPKAQGAVVLERAMADGELHVPAGTVVAVAADGPRFALLEDAIFDAGQVQSAPAPIQALFSGEAGNVGAAAITEIEGVQGITSVTNPGATAGGAPDRAWLYGILLAIAVGLVILGGIKSIGRVASIIVPVMCGVYILAGLFIVVTNMDQIVPAFSHILSQAFTPEAGRGGLLGVLVQGFRRAAFSNEAGVGSAAIAHSAASTDEPVREGIVASLGPFIDTIVVCTMTGLVVVITGAYQMDVGDGVLMTSAAFGSVIDWFPLVLSFAVVMFAFSTMISWSYYGERCATWLLGEWASLPYKLVFLVCVFFGSVFKLGNVLDFSDLMVLGMAFPNIFGVLILSGEVRKHLDDYWSRLKSGQMARR